MTTQRSRFVAVVLLALSVAGSGQASAQESTPTPVATTRSESELRPATTTFWGDTGLWFVPSAETLATRQWAISAYRRGTNYRQGYTNVGDFAGTFAVGITQRLEFFGSLLVDTRIDRDTRPLFQSDPSYGGVVDRYPQVASPWTGNHLGDLYVGAKINLWSQAEQKPAAFAVRGMVKIPTGDAAAGVSTGKTDVLLDAIVSRNAARLAEVAGYVGWEVDGQPVGLETPRGAFRWGAGVGMPSRGPVRGTFELTGLVPTRDTARLLSCPRPEGCANGLVGSDGSVPPLASPVDVLTRGTVGLTVQAPKGFFVGAGASWNFPRQTRNPALAQDNPFADYWDWQVRIGFHPGTRAAVVPAAPPAPVPAPAASAAAPNGPPTVSAQCDPCTVEVGARATVRSDARDPDSDPLEYRWSAPRGALVDPAAPETIWTAPMQDGPVAVTITVDDGHGGTATDTVTIQVVRSPVRTYAFEDIYFDFDRFTLRPEAIRLLDDAVTVLTANSAIEVRIEGHTCNIGTSEYNLALGERRASAVRDYLVGRGIAAGRLRTISYGEEQPKYDNSREETRRLNRRAALNVTLQ